MASLTFDGDERKDWVDEYGLQMLKYELLGHAVVGTDVLHLTLDAPHQMGSCLIRPLTPPDMRPVSGFTATFDMMIGGSCGARGGSVDCGADGLSFVFGDVPSVPFGEGGAGDGLRVLFQTYPQRRYIVVFAGRQYATGRLDEGLRAHHPQQVEVSYSGDKLWLRPAARGCSRASGSRTGQAHGAGLGAHRSLHDAHWVDRSRSSRASSARRGALPLEVTPTASSSRSGAAVHVRAASRADGPKPASGPATAARPSPSPPTSRTASTTAVRWRAHGRARHAGRRECDRCRVHDAAGRVERRRRQRRRRRPAWPRDGQREHQRGTSRSTRSTSSVRIAVVDSIFPLSGPAERHPAQRVGPRLCQLPRRHGRVRPAGQHAALPFGALHARFSSTPARSCATARWRPRARCRWRSRSTASSTTNDHVFLTQPPAVASLGRAVGRHWRHARARLGRRPRRPRGGRTGAARRGGGGRGGAT